MNEFFRTVVEIKTPLGLAGLFGGILFLSARQIIAKIPAPDRSAGVRLLDKALTGFLALAFTALLLGISAWVYVQVKGDGLSPNERVTSVLQDKVMVVKAAWEASLSNPGDKATVLSEGPALGQRLLAVPDNDMRPAWRIIKLQYATMAYTMAASDHPTNSASEIAVKKDLIQKALDSSENALAFIRKVKASTDPSKDAAKARDFVVSDESEERVLYHRAIAYCRQADIGGVGLKEAAATLQQITNISYLTKYPVGKNPEFATLVTARHLPPNFAGL